jgi:hypothetical protein
MRLGKENPTDQIRSFVSVRYDCGVGAAANLEFPGEPIAMNEEPDEYQRG